MSTSILNASADRNEQGLGTVLHFHLPIREMLTRDIERDTHVGDRLAIEEKVCDQFGVSRELMRDAWRGLDSDGIISRTRGQGTFVERLASACRETRLTGLSYDAEARELAKGALVAADVGPPNDGQPLDENGVPRLAAFRCAPTARSARDSAAPRGGSRVERRDFVRRVKP
jgi:DNA-binding transcriptional regulator YhcF (GntR family)